CSPSQFKKVTNLPAAQIKSKYKPLISGSKIAARFKNHQWTTRATIEREIVQQPRHGDYVVVFGEPSPEPTSTPTKNNLSYRQVAATAVATKIMALAGGQSSTKNDELRRKLEAQQARMEQNWTDYQREKYQNVEIY
ncbi:MAG: hypothetical protein ACREOZ_02000, partial [Gloeomargaritales cyanobacterium]